MCLFSYTLTAQLPHPLIQQLVNEMEDDSLLLHVNDLSGEKSCMLNGKITTIKNRVSKTGNDPAADYLKERMESYGFTVIDQKYSSGGRNIIAEQKGTLYPDKKYIICAHYDAMADYCADDNVSSCSTILETARLLSKHKFKYTIVYAFWDEEEVGMLGSTYYAKAVKKNNDKIMGVINIEMQGYDSDNDGKYDIHTNSTSLTLSNKVKEINAGYKFNLKTNIINPGTDRSDHGAFWNQGYNAICFGEAFFSGDDNPNYHKATDRIKVFNLPYYYELAHLSLAAIATFAEPDDDENGITVISDPSKIKLETYPNPAKESMTVSYELIQKEKIEIVIYNMLGGQHKILFEGTKEMGAYRQMVDTQNLPPGIYIIAVKTNKNTYSKRVVIAK